MLYRKLGKYGPDVSVLGFGAMRLCGECEEQCPQHISIREELKKAHETLH